MDTGSQIQKDPDATGWLRGIDWTTYLARISDTETIASSAWGISGRDGSLTMDEGSDVVVTGSKKTSLRLSGGTRGVKYTVTNTIVTSSAMRDDRSFVVLVEDQ